MSEIPFYCDNGVASDALPLDAAFTDGLLETMRCEHGCIPLWPRHRARLLRSGIVPPGLIAPVERALSAALDRFPDAALKVRLRIGIMQGEFHWDFAVTKLGTVPALQGQARLYRCSTRLRESDSANAGCKSLLRSRYNRAKAEIPADAEPCEGLLLDTRGNIIETLHCNLLLYLGDSWCTPDLSRSGVRGVMRDWLSDQIGLQEQELSPDDLEAAQEVALCNSVRGVIPVVELIGHHCWSPGSETRHLQQLVTEALW